MSKFHCEVCDITMNKKSQYKHKRSTAHLNRVNGVERQPAKTTFTCNACNITISTKSKSKHLRSANHLKKTSVSEKRSQEQEQEEKKYPENPDAIIDEWNSMQDELRRLKKQQEDIQAKLERLRTKKNDFKRIHGEFLNAERQRQRQEAEQEQQEQQEEQEEEEEEEEEQEE